MEERDTSKDLFLLVANGKWLTPLRFSSKKTGFLNSIEVSFLSNSRFNQPLFLVLCFGEASVRILVGSFSVPVAWFQLKGTDLISVAKQGVSCTHSLSFTCCSVLGIMEST